MRPGSCRNRQELIGQWLPPGASGSLLRSVAYFDGSAAGLPAVTLTLWAALGLTAVLVGGRRRGPVPTSAHSPAAEPAVAA